MTFRNLDTLEKWLSSSPPEEEQTTALLDTETTEVRDAELHTRLAEWALELGQPSVALREWNLAHRDDPQNTKVLENLMTCYLDCGQPEKALKIATQLTALEPQSVEFWEERISLESHLARHEEATDSQNRAFLLTQDPRFQQELKQEAEEQPALFDDTLLVLLQETFAGREGVYALQWVDEDGRTGYSPIRQPLTLKVVRNHLLGNHTLGVYLLRMDNTVHFAAVDLDLSPVVVKNCAPGTPGWREAYQALESFALQLKEVAKQHNMTLHLEESGYKGCHLWAFFQEPVPARMARTFLRQLLEPLAVPPVIRYEIFPKQNSVPTDGLGNLIKIPLGIHRKTGKRAWFKSAPQDLEAQRLWLQKAEKISREQLVQAYQQALNSGHPDTLPPQPDSSPPKDQPSSHELAWEPEYVLSEDAEAQQILARCATLRCLVGQAEEQAQLSHDEARVLIHTLGHLTTGPLAVNSLLSRCMESDSSLYLRRPLRGNPMSCAKIRARIPEVTSNLPCDCHFPSTSGLYPTPALHLRKNSAQVPLDHLQFQALFQDFLRAKKELFRLQRLVETQVERLNAWFDQAGEEVLETSMGRFRRTVSQEGEVSFELLV